MKTRRSLPLRSGLGLSFLLALGAVDVARSRPTAQSGQVRSCCCLSGYPPTLKAVTHGGGVWVVVGSDTIRTSTALIRWRCSQPLPGVNLRGITYHNGLFVAVGDHGLVLTSPDAANWTQRGVPVRENLRSVTAGGGEFVAVGCSGTILGTTNGINWTSRPSGVADELRGICYAHGRFVAVGSRQTILTSIDARNWTRVGTRSSVGLKAVAAGSQGFVAVGCSVILTSPDGLLWQSKPAGGQAAIMGVDRRMNRWVVVGKAGLTLTSSDERQWVQRWRTPALDLHGVHYAQGRFVAVGKNGTILISRSGAAWEQAAP